MACSPPPTAARSVAPLPKPLPSAAAAPTPVASPWPDVARSAQSDKAGQRDAALVIAVERRQGLPPLTGARLSGEDWARFFPAVLGTPAERVTTLFDAAATPSAIASALRATAATVAPGARLWFVAVGYVGVSEADLSRVLASSNAQLVSVLDVPLEDARKLALFTHVATRPGALPLITLSTTSPTPLAGAERSAFSYLLMGALRGWGDRDRDGRVTAWEAATYVDFTLGALASRDSTQARAKVRASDDLVCSELTTLSVAREPAPHDLELPPHDESNTWAQQLYGHAEREVDATRARCAWSAVANSYTRSWWRDSAAPSQAEAALNGAYAWSKLGRSDDAAALYRSYVKELGGAKAGESERSANERRQYVGAACVSYLELAKAEPRLFPGYFEACRNFRCTLGPARCAEWRANAKVVPLGASSGEAAHARELSLAAQDHEELAGWEPTEAGRASRLREASERYAAAEAAWAVLAGRANAADPANATLRLAEITVRRLALELATGVEVPEKDVERARQLARTARDLSSDERRADAARLLVELADALLARHHPAVEKAKLPSPVAAAIEARDEYIASVPATFDAAQLRYRMSYEAAELLFRYGHFTEARQHLELPYAQRCQVNPVAHEAWVLLLSLANQAADADRARSLATDAAICPSDVETRVHAERLRKPVLGIPFVLEARRQLQASEALPGGAQRRALRREAAATFRQFVLEGPDRDEAPASTLRAAELYVELDQHALALEMYRRFVDRYGRDRASAPDLERAYAELVRLHARLGDYRAAARALFEQSEHKRLPAQVRAAAARKARELRKDRDGRGL